MFFVIVSLCQNYLLFCYTDFITTEIYSQIYLKQVPAILYELEKQVQYDQYFLFDIDVPWVEDGLRDLGKKRSEMFAIFRVALEIREIPYTVVPGRWSEREELVRSVIDEILK